MSEHAIQPVILSGGSGTRLWPLSRAGFPKQFLCLTGTKSLFQLAVERVAKLEVPGYEIAGPLIVTGEEHRFLTLEQLREIGVDSGGLLLEPMSRNTAPALTMAALSALDQGNDPILVVTPADQVIEDDAGFKHSIAMATHEAGNGAIVILGITPNRPETGYGYIKATQAEGAQSASLFSVQRFVEKPDVETARHYLEQGGYFWNAGIFVLKASVWLAALNRFRKDIALATSAAWSRRAHETIAATIVSRPGTVEFAAIPSESIDYSVIEHCPESDFPIKMISLDAGWSDLGAWDAVWQALPKDEAGNARVGDVLVTGSRNSLVYANSRLVSLIGADNMIVVETTDVVLVANKDCVQDVKGMVSLLAEQNREEHSLHRKVHRPWGWYDCVDEGQRFKVKRIQVKPGCSLSLQKHHHRAEHWVVVKGTAEIRCNEETLLLTENQSTYIPLGAVHRLVNPGDIPLEIIEIQSGGYLAEDDIVRYDDQYGRVE